MRRTAAGNVIDFSAKLSAPRGDVQLNGDPEHAGIHFRPAGELDTKKTLYHFPAEKPNAHKDTDSLNFNRRNQAVWISANRANLHLHTQGLTSACF